MNKMTIIGNLVRDPETRTTTNGATATSFTVATDRRFPSNGEKVTDYFRVTAWRQLGETCAKYLAKGKKVYVSGELQARLYEGRDGDTRLSLDIEADQIEFLSPRSNGDASPAATPAPATANDATSVNSGDAAGSDEDLPF